MKDRGFTLIEVMVAMVIFSLMTVLAVTGLRSLMTADERQRVHTARLAQLQMAKVFLSRDLEQIINRPIYAEDGQLFSGFIGNPSTGLMQFSTEVKPLLEMTRMGIANPLSQEERSTLLRVAYVLREGSLVRFIWPELDRKLKSKPIEKILFSHIESLRLNYVNASGAYQESWMLNYPGVALVNHANLQSAVDLPAAVQMTITLKKIGVIEWYWLLPGGLRRAKPE